MGRTQHVPWPTGVSGRSGHVARKLAVLLVIISWADAPSLFASEAVTRDGQQPESVYEEIVVTAERRETLARETPVAMSILDGEVLERYKLNNILDLSTMVPGLNVGREFNAAQIAIRGIGNENVFMGADPGVAFHVDDVYIARSEATLASFYDVERIEVLRGPQGTLYGRNSTGGVLNLISRAPTPQFESQLYAEYGNYDQIGVGGFLSGPLVGESVLGRLSFRTNERDGYIHNIVPGQPDLSDEKFYSVRGQLQLQLSDALEVIVRADYHEDDAKGSGRKALGTRTGSPGVPELFLGATKATGKFEVASDLDNHYDTDLKGTSATVNWDLDAVRLTSITAYRESSASILFDADLTNVPHQFVTFDDSSDQFSQELRLTSGDDSKLQWIVGAYYFDDQSSQDVETLATHVILSLNPLVLVPFHALLGGDLDTESYAFFGNASWPVIEDKLNVRVGARYTNDTKEIDEYNIVTVAAFPTNARAGSDQTSWGEDTYQAVVEYFPFEKTMLYANVSTGFKAGGYNAGALTPAFDPENVTSYELGLKSRFFDDRADASIAVFYADYEDLQTAQVGPLTVIVSNAAKAEMQGVELEGSVVITDGFRLSGTFAYLDATFEEYLNSDTANPGAGIQDLSGLNLPNAPEVTLSITPEYSFNIGALGRLTLFGLYSYRSRDYLEQFNHPHFSQPSVDLFDAGASFETVNGKVRVSAYGKNLTDEEVLNSLFVSSGITLAVGSGDVSLPRTYGVRVEYNF